MEEDNRGNGEREFVEFICLRIFDKRKKGKRGIIGEELLVKKGRREFSSKFHFACFCKMKKRKNNYY